MNIEHYLFKKDWEKLIEPLEKYLLELAKKNPLCTNLNVNLPWVSILWVHETILISEKFWFIQWLVKHFMLNMTKIDARIALSDFNATDRMLMALAISDNPIELLIDCLK